MNIRLPLVVACLTSFGAMAQSYQQPLPLLQATEFAPGVISTEAFEINTVLDKNGDSVIFSRCDDAFSHCVLMESRFTNGKWQQPQTLPFSGNYPDADPYYSSDFSTLYYISKRPIDNSGQVTEFYNHWRVTRTAEGWSAPEYLPSMSSNTGHDLYPSLDDAGHLYFPSLRDEQRHLYKAERTATGFAAPKPLPEHIYGNNGRTGDAVVARNGKLIIFSISGRDDSAGRGDLYVSRLVGGEWTVAESLGPKVNTENHEFTPIIAPDDKTLFFTRIEDGVGNLYQIDLSAVNISLEMVEEGQLAYRAKALEAMQKNQTLAGIKLDQPWKKALYQLSANTMQHPAWGMNHSERNYLLTQRLAEEEGVTIDNDVLFAAAFLHDMATFQPWANGTDHSARASELAPHILADVGFPKAKIRRVRDLIEGHMFYASTTDAPLAQLFHDADTLDFMGVTGITRILSLNGKGAWATNTAKAIETLQGFTQQLPATLRSESAKKRGEKRLADMQKFLQTLKTDTFGYKAP